MWFALLKQVRSIVVLLCFCRTGTPAITNTIMLRFDPTNLSILEGNSGTLTCNISNSDIGVYIIRWNAEVSYVYHPQENCRVTGPLTNTQAYNVTCINEDVQIAILHVSRDRHGEVWTCQRILIDNNLYESKSTLNVTVPVTNVRLETQNEYTTTKENTPTKFECVTSAGYPEATIRWYKNNTLLNNSDVSTYSTLSNKYLKVVRSTLTLHLRRAENSSRIHCAAKNNDTTWQYSNRTTVIVYYSPGVPIVTKDSRPVQGEFAVKEGNEVNVICAASSFPEPTHSWIIPNGTSIAGDRLQIIKITRAGGGNYTCKAINTMRLSSRETIQGENKSSINVHVLYAPSQPTLKYMRSDNNIHNSLIDKSLYVVRNDNFTLTCATDSQPSPSYRWTWTGNINIQETNTNTLTVVSIQDDMNLTCTATNTMKETFGMTSTQSANYTISIIVLYPPRNPEFRATNGDRHVQENIYNVNVKEGDTITVTCQADSRPTPYGYYWSVDSYINNAALRLTNVKRTQTGTYSCEARNRMNRTFGNPAVGKQSNSININVLSIDGIRLMPVGGKTYEGFVEVKINGNWLVMSRNYSTFDDRTANVLCKTFGFRTYGYSTTSLQAFVLKKTVTLYEDLLVCNGNEVDATECVFGVLGHRTTSILEAGWTKLHCSLCDDIHYGQNCSHVCDCELNNVDRTKSKRSCDVVTGSCACKSDWTGSRCEIVSTPEDTTMLIIIITLSLVIVLLLVVIIIVCVYKYRKRTRKGFDDSSPKVPDETLKTGKRNNYELTETTRTTSVVEYNTISDSMVDVDINVDTEYDIHPDLLERTDDHGDNGSDGYMTPKPTGIGSNPEYANTRIEPFEGGYRSYDNGQRQLPDAPIGDQMKLDHPYEDLKDRRQGENVYSKMAVNK